MPVNPFDQPAQAQFINTYTPVPFQEILQAGQTRQQRYDVNRATFEQAVAEANELRGIPGADQAYIEGTVVPTLQEISDAYAARDYGDPEVVREINRRVREGVDRRLVSNIQQSYGNYQQYLKGLADLKAKGVGTPQGLIPRFDQHSTEEFGIFTGTPEAALDFRKSTREFFEDFKPRFLGVRQISPDREGVVHGVTLEDLQQHAMNNVGVWLQDPAGNQKVRELRALGFQGSDEEIALDFLLRQAPEFIQDRVTSVYDISGRVDDRERFTFPSTASSEAIQLGLEEPISTKFLQNRDFNEQGEIREKGVLKPWKLAASLGNELLKAVKTEDYHLTGKGLRRNIEDKLKQEKSFWRTNKQKERESIKGIKSTYPSLSNLSDKEALERYENAVKDFSTGSINLAGSTLDVSEEFTRRYVNANIHRDMMILDGHGKTNFDKKEVLKQLNKTEEEVINYINDPKTKTKVGGFTHQGDQPGMFFFEIPDKKGRRRRVLFSSDDQIKSATRLSNDIYKGMLTMLPAVISSGAVDRNGIPIDYKIIPNINPETGEFDFVIVEGQKTVNEVGQEDFIPDLDETGQPSIIDITEIQQLERRNLELLGIL